MDAKQPPHVSCPDHASLLALSRGEIPQEQADAMFAHLEWCDRCQSLVQRLSHDEGLRVLSRLEPDVDEFPAERALRETQARLHVAARSAEVDGDAGAFPERIGRYRLLSRIGQGGMGTVFKAVHTRLKRVVALKVLPVWRTVSERSLARFQREMEVVGRLEHPHIVRATDAGEWEGTHFLVMEYLQGVNLSRLVKERGPLPIAEACEIIRQAAEGLAYVHAQGLVHRDIKPSNLMLAVSVGSSTHSSRPREAGEVRAQPQNPQSLHAEVKILDLGLALLNDPQVPELTHAGQAMGTVDYMAPEQFSDSHRVDDRADVYGLGCTLYFLLCGCAPFAGEAYDTAVKKMLAHANASPPRLRDRRPEACEELVALLEQMLAKEPASRPDAAHVARTLLPLAAGADLATLVGGHDEFVETASRTGLASVESEPPERDLAANAAVSQSTFNELYACSTETSQDEQPPALRPADDALAILEECISRHADPVVERILRQHRKRKKIRSRWWKRAGVAAALLLTAGLTVCLAGVVFRVKTKQGTLVVQVDQPHAVVEIDGEKAKVRYSPDGRTLTVFVDPGTHRLAVTTPDGLTLQPDSSRFTITAGGKEIIKARLIPSSTVGGDVVPGSAPRAPASGREGQSPDRRAAEWVLSLGGRVTVEVNGRQREVTNPADLPDDPLRVVGIDLYNGHAARSSQVTDADLVRLKDLTQLKALDLKLTRVEGPGLAHLARLTELENLSLEYTRVTDAALVHLEGLTKLTTLRLGWNWERITDKGLVHLRGLKRLRVLGLSGTRVGEAGLAHLAGLTQLEYLELERTPITDADLVHLKNLTELKDLNLRYTHITGPGLEHLRNTKVYALWLRNARITDAGLVHLKALPHLQVVDLDETQITDQGLAFLAKELPKLHWIELGGTQITDAGLAHLRDRTNIRHLFLGRTPITDAGLKHLERLTNLIKLRLDATAITDAGLVHIRGMHKLGWLNLSQTQVTEAGLVHIRGLKNLGWINLSQTPITDAALETLVSLPNLKVIDLRNTRVSFNGYQMLRTAFPNTQIHWSERHYAAAEAVLNSGRRVELALGERTVTVEPGQPLPGELFTLTGVDFSGHDNLPADLWDRLLAPPSIETLERLNLSGVKLSDHTLAGLAAFKNLSELSLAGTRITDDDLAWLKPCGQLRRLDLDGTRVAGPGLVNLLGLEHLQELGLECPELTSVGLQYVAQLKQLRRLSLAGSRVTDLGLQQLDALTQLESLDLRRTEVTAEGVRKLQDALPNCRISADVR